MMIVRVRAPFAAFRPFTAGAFRSTAPFVTPSAAYGLLMNLAGIETRLDDGTAVATQVRSDLPQVEMALGAVTPPQVQTIFQQLHNYPVGSSGEDHAEDCFGSKYNIQPVRREFLSGIDVCIAVRADGEVEGAVRSAVRGEPGLSPRYGVPFLGDNAFLVDRLEELESPPPCRWYRRLGEGETGAREGLCRLTIWIDRADMSRTRSALFYPESQATTEVPAGAWIGVGP